MFERRELLCVAVGTLLLPRLGAAEIQRSASDRLNELGPENTRLATLTGTWDVVESIWSNPGASPPKVLSGLVADRRMIGSMLEETLRRPPDPTPLRIDYLTFNRVEGQWQYVSMDFRAPVGIMPACSFDRGDNDRIELFFQPLAVPGDGMQVSGLMLRMKQLITPECGSRQIKDQTFITSDGSAAAWLAHRYTYVRQS